MASSGLEDNRIYDRRQYEDDDSQLDHELEGESGAGSTVPTSPRRPAPVGDRDQHSSVYLIPVEEAARLLGVGRTTLFRLIGDGRVKTVRLSRRRLVLRSGLDRFVEEVSS